MLKITNIADSIHESIPVSPFEKAVLSTTIFNRLHNVLQTSTLYLTFPSARHSRFSHSIGCMHIAGKVFLSGIKNASQKTVSEFLDSIGEEISEIEQDEQTFGSHYAHTFSDLDGRGGQQVDFKDNGDLIFDHPFYQGVLTNLENTRHGERANLLLASYQAARIAALLHDVGHPPFSHVAEFALTDIYNEYIKEDLEDESAKKNFVDLLSPFNPPSFHEGVSERLSREIITQATKRLTSRQSRYNEFIVGQLALRALRKNGIGRESSLKSMIDGVIDVDRLDFVSRDRVMTALGRQPVGIERLLSSFQLVKNPSFDDDNKGVSPFLFLPSARSISTVEEVLERRFEFYRYAVSHHRVKKTDGLMRRAIRHLAQDQLENRSEAGQQKRKAFRGTQLPIDISGLWIAFEGGMADTPADFATRVSQWDDSWLITVLRHYNHSPQTSQAVKKMLDELLSGRKGYVTLYKRLDDFWEVDKAFQEASSGTNWASLGDIISSGMEDLKARVQPHLLEIVKLIKSREEGYNGGGLLLSHLEQTFFYLGKRKESWLYTSLDKAIKRLVAEYKIEDAFYAPIKVKPGVSPSDPLAINQSDGEKEEGGDSASTVPISDVSDVAKRLKERSLFIPPFYVFVFGIDMDKALPEMRRRLGELLWDEFLNQMTAPVEVIT